MILRPGRAEPPGAGAQNRDGLAVERLLRRARSPVDRVLQHARDRVVVFGRGDQQRVRLGDLAAKGDHGLGEALGLDVPVIGGNGGEIGEFDRHAVGRQLSSGPERRRVEGVFPQTPRNSKHLHAPALPFPLAVIRPTPLAPGHEGTIFDGLGASGAA